MRRGVAMTRPEGLEQAAPFVTTFDLAAPLATRLPTPPNVNPAAAVWLHTPPSPATLRQRALLVGALLLFAAALWWLVPHGIGVSWRECDTQSIARNLVEDGYDVLHPRVEWRGDTDGSVECEFPLYQLGIAALLTVFGDVEWPGRAISLAATVVAAWSLWRLLRRRVVAGSALAGTLAFLVTGSAMLVGTRVQPDALCLAFGLSGMVAFVDFLAGGRWRDLALATVLLALAGLEKPLALQLGLLAFGWSVVLAPRRLREGRTWLAYVAIAGIVALWLWHGYRLWQTTGLSFGVIGGDDSKFPGAQVLTGKVWLNLAWTTLHYGLGPLGVSALLLLAVRRRLDASDVILAAAVFAGLVVSLRYSYHGGLGPHYHMWAASAGAWFVGRAFPERADARWWLPFLVCVAVCGGWRLREERGMRKMVNASPWLTAAQQIRDGSGLAERMIVRGDFPRYDELWRRGNNFEDPRLFYQARRRGWALAVDGCEPERLDRLRKLGAAILVDMQPSSTPADMKAWLLRNAEPWLRNDAIAVYRLHTGG